MKRALFGIFAMLACMGVFAQQPVVAVAPFDAISGISATDANMITRVFFIRLGNTGKVSLVDRGVVERVLKEHSFQAGDWSNQQKTAELGKALNTDWIVRGEMENFGNSILVTVQFYDIQTFRFMGGADLRLANADEAYDKMDPLVDKLVQTIADTGSRPSAVRPQSTRTQSKEYKIGDFGPAGGIVFYDKGIFSGGWRYLEAAPVETEVQATNWGSSGYSIPGTGTAVGSGKRNTQLIVEHLNRRGESSYPAQLCANLDFDGFTDWFLPSKDELDLMNENLRRKGLGNFNNYYWSSSNIDSTQVWGLTSSGSKTTEFTKGGGGYVRAIRAF